MGINPAMRIEAAPAAWSDLRIHARTTSIYRLTLPSQGKALIILPQNDSGPNAHTAWPAMLPS